MSEIGPIPSLLGKPLRLGEIHQETPKSSAWKRRRSFGVDSAPGETGHWGMVMKRKSFQPGFDAMEPRLALSSSNFFSSFFDSIFAQNNSNSNTPHYTAAQIAKIKAHRQALREARQERLAAFHAAHPHPAHHA